MKAQSLIGVAVLLLCITEGQAGAPVRADYRVRGLDAAQFEPGELRLPLTVHERSGVAREGVVVSSGVPFPPGFLMDEERLGVVDEAGRPVPSQAMVMVRWWKPTYDDSVQWALVSFLCDVPANGTSTYYLTDDGRAASPATALELVRAGENGHDAHTIQTGPATFVVPDSGDALIARATFGDVEVIGGDGLRGVLQTGEWADRGLDAGDRHTATFEPDGVTIEEHGPVRTVIAIKGRYAPGDRDARMYDFTARMYFAVNSPSVRVIFTIRNGVLDPTLIDGRRRVYIWPIEDASLVADLSFGKPRATTLADGAEVSAPELVAYQDSSGGDKWQELGGGNYERWLSRYTEGREVRGVTFRGYKVTGRGEELAAGDRHLGVVDVAGERAGVTAALRNFRVEYPSAVGAADGHLRVGLFPGEFAEPFHLNSGQRKSWDVRLTLHGPDKPDLARAHAVQDALLLFRPDPAWMVRCAAAGAWPSGLALFAPERPPRLRWEAKPDLDGIHTGWDWYGWISSWNAGGAHWNQSTCFAPWVLWADGANLDQAESRALWAGDVCAIHYDDAPMETFWLMLRSWNWRENRLVAETPPGYYSRDTWGLPDSGHMGMFMWPEYYLITGDARAREAWEHLGIRARAFCWQHNHDDKADGTGPLPRAIHWCRKRDPDTEPEFRLADRYRGWPLYGLAQYYRLTGRPELLAEARTVARAFRNTARMSPIGFMVTQINAKDDPSVYGRQGPFETGRAESASQCYAHFQQGIMATGLVEYYLMSRDIEALDALVAFADQTCHHSMIRDPEGNRKGWTYTFGDYWGPYTWEDCDGHRVSFFASNFRVLQPLGFIYTLTGRQDYRDVLRDAFNEPRRGGYDGSVIAAWMAVKHPKARAQPPAAVDDLTAEPLGGGRAELTWTAPEGAAWYQVKWSEADIVERVSGWPDRTPPLPEDAEQWHARAEAFNARQRSFWAANNAPATPMPARAAGETETVVVEGLPAGAVRFAVKAWDEADNISELSNVVRIDIENNE